MNTEEIYRKRINRAIDYISENLDANLTIEEISREVCFSTYHFHRIFRAYTGESLYAFVCRLRVEKAASLLLTTTGSITETSFEVGFNDTAVFSRAFKKRFGCSASLWMREKSKNHQVGKSHIPYTDTIFEDFGSSVTAERVYFHHFPERRLLYLRDFGSFAGNAGKFLELHRRLDNLLQSHQIRWHRKEGFFLIYHDTLGIAMEERLRISYGVLSDQEGLDEIPLGTMNIPSHTYVMVQFSLGIHEYGKAWTDVYRRILPRRGLEAVDGICFENYTNSCYNRDTGKTEVVIGVPVKKMTRSIQADGTIYCAE